jgi:hypothetical protein
MNIKTIFEVAKNTMRLNDHPDYVKNEIEYQKAMARYETPILGQLLMQLKKRDSKNVKSDFNIKK